MIQKEIKIRIIEDLSNKIDHNLGNIIKLTTL